MKWENPTVTKYMIALRRPSSPNVSKAVGNPIFPEFINIVGKYRPIGFFSVFLMIRLVMTPMLMITKRAPENRYRISAVCIFILVRDVNTRHGVVK